MNENLIQAVKTGDEDLVAAFLASEPSLAGGCDEHGVSLIFVALYHQQEAVAQRLASCVPGLSLHESAALGHLECLIGQLDRDQELVNTHTRDGFTALHLAAYFGRDEALALLLDYGADPKLVTTGEARLLPLNCAAAGGHLKCVRLLLKVGAAVDAVQAGHVTSLMSAAARNSRAIADLLLQHGANRELRSQTNFTAADYARERGHFQLADYLAQ